MKTGISHSILAVAAAALASAALAQNPAPPQPNPQPSPPEPDPRAAPQPAPAPGARESVPEVTESQLDTFTTIYVDLQELNREFQEELAEIQTEEEAVEVQARMQEASTEVIEDHDWTLDMYNQVATAINAQPEVLRQALELINEKS